MRAAVPAEETMLIMHKGAQRGKGMEGKKLFGSIKTGCR
jgi:hypothetical protein